jgi:sugar-specific transcriptional regulator TrmB
MGSLEALEKAGLNRTEAKVYFALLKIGSASGSEIAEKAGVFRRNAYDALRALSEKGLAKAIIKDKKYYLPVEPSKLEELLEEKKKNLQNAMPELEGLYSSRKEKQKAYFFEGIEGYKTILNEILKEGKEWLCFISSGQSTEILGKEWTNYWESKRISAGIKAKWIVNNTPAGMKRGKKVEKLGLTEARILESIKVINPTTTYVFGDKVAIMLWSKPSPTAVMVESREIAEANRKYFEVLWKMAKKY